MKLVIDTDPGTDDVIALMMALNSPEVEVLGLTTVGGNASLADTTRNALGLLEHQGRPDIPVSQGASRPLHGSYSYSYHFHGPHGLTVRLPPPTSKTTQEMAPEFIVEQARKQAGDLVLIALGPLTNVARALDREPRLSEWLKGIVVMGGAVEVPGNMRPHRRAEFNVYNDPEAAQAVLSSGIPITLVGLDVCDKVCVYRDEAAWLSDGSILERLPRSLLANWFAADSSREQYQLCDPLAVVAVLMPNLLTFQAASVTVDTDQGEERGSTTARYGDGTVRVATGVQAPEAKSLMVSLLSESAGRA